MEERIDELDKVILNFLNKNGRDSLTNLAKQCPIKTSTLYHRLKQLEKNKVIKGYSLVINPEIYEIEKICLLKIKTRPQKIEKLNDEFIDSFAEYLSNETPNALFVSTMEDKKHILMMTPVKDRFSFIQWVEHLKKNPYIETICTQFINSIIKGQQLFTYFPELISSNMNIYENENKTPINDDEFDEDELDMIKK